MTPSTLHAWVRLLAEPASTARALEELLARPGEPDPEVRRSIEAWLRLVRPLAAPEGVVGGSSDSSSVARAHGPDDRFDDEPWEDDVLDDDPWDEETPFDRESPLGPDDRLWGRTGLAKGAA